MIDIVKYDPSEPGDRLTAILGRTIAYTPDLEASVRDIVDQVRQRGDAAVRDYTNRFDGVDQEPGEFRVPASEIETAHREADPALKEVIQAAVANIRRFHEAQKRTSWFIEDGDGVVLGKRVLPLRRVGLLVPGASAPLFSTLLMAAVPARIAGVDEICLATPPDRHGQVHPSVLTAARMVGITEVYRVFGAQAVAALAFGTDTIPAVDKLVGPGHPTVQIAKKLVFGTVDIDMIAGPSEIVVLADGMANPKYAAADMLSQAEHGSGFEAAVCITPDPNLAERVRDELEKQAADLAHARSIRTALKNFGAIVIVKDLNEGLSLANRIAPEHIELLVEEPWQHLDQVHNAGAVFLGPASSEPVGDYYAGTNHILPTAGAARFASSVGVDTYLKTVSVVAYTERRLEKTAGHIIRMAEAEGLDAHANAVRVRHQ